MRRELEDALAARFPFFVPSKFAGGVCAHGDGWHDILEWFLTEFAKLNLPAWFCVIMVQEKSGELRIDSGCFSAGRPQRLILGSVERLAWIAREQSWYACEVCGNIARRRNTLSRPQVLCNNHYWEATAQK